MERKKVMEAILTHYLGIEGSEDQKTMLWELLKRIGDMDLLAIAHQLRLEMVLG